MVILGPTSRSSTRSVSTALDALGYPPTQHPDECEACQGEEHQIWVNPDLPYSDVGFFNMMGLDISENLHAYAFGGWGTRQD